jgi:hypothetical protein
MSTTTPPTTRTTLRHPDLGTPWAIQAHHGHEQHRGYPRVALRIPARVWHRPPTAHGQLMLRNYPTRLGVRLSTATPHELASDITVGRAVELD